MKPKPTILELCCGWKSVSNAFATNHHWHTATVDILPKFKPTLLTDVIGSLPLEWKRALRNHWHGPQLDTVVVCAYVCIFVYTYVYIYTHNM